MSNNALFAAFKFSTTGESLRGLQQLRIKQYDRNLELASAQLVNARVEAERAEADVVAYAQRAAVRSAIPAGMTGMGQPDLQQYKRNLEELENGIEVMRLNRNTLQWFHDQLVPTDRYELSAFDVQTLGIELREGPPSVRALFGRMY